MAARVIILRKEEIRADRMGARTIDQS